MKTTRHWLNVVAVAATIAFCAASVQAQPFYEGKTVRVIHGFGAGGGFHRSGEVVTRHLTKHVPGNPTFVVESMKGAGALIAMNYVYNKSKPDGLTIGYLFANQLVREVLGGTGIQFDSTKYKWLASPSYTTAVCTTTAASGIKSIDDWRNAKEPVKFGAISRQGDLAHDIPKLLSALAGLPVKIVVGHKGGNPDMKLAAERGEIAGFCASIEATRIVWGEALDAGTAQVLIQIAENPDPMIPDVPTAKKLVSDEDWLLFAAAVANPGRMTRVFAFPPGTPDDKVQLMRKALMETFADPDFRAEAKKLKVSVNPVSGEEVERLVAQMHSLPPATIERLKELLSGE
ncbi:MAG: hypothetical protein E4H01_13875 [Lysobacterales bacterium]|nr:MAG: hypothetical protein E4H01_13875 [Xanthomonadales bacterium]